MKCGIMTFHRAVNYGAVLQAYALQKFISESFDADCEIIDYRCQSIEAMYKVPLNKLNPLSVIKHYLCGRKQKAFNDFLDKYMEMSPSYSKSQLPNTVDNYDIIISGSDQVWGKSRVGKDESYFLDFVDEPKKKVSYAASVGSGKIEDGLKENYRELLNDFSFLGVREYEVAKSLEILLNRTVHTNLDPTLLLNKSQWETVASDRLKGKKYLLLYMLTNSQSIIDAARKLAKEKHLEIYNISDSFHNVKGIKNLRFLSPSEWVGAFMNASYVMTNSFHGTAFAINFKKDFNSEITKTLSQRGSRISCLLDTVGLSDRMMGDVLNTTSIDYGRVENSLVAERDKSISYLKDVIKEGEQNEICDR